MKAAKSRSIPNYFIIGAAKSGTTSLFEIISQHPDVFGSKIKETRFFSNDKFFEKGLAWYQETHFPNSSGYKVRFESTPSYLTWSQKVAPRLKALYGNQPVKFTAILRDPVKRAYSHYWHRVRLGHENPEQLSFEDAIHSEEKRLHDNWQTLEYEGDGLYGYFRAGCYASLLRPYLDIFPRENFLFLLQQDLYKDFTPRMAEVLRFLGIDETYRLKPVKRNDSAVPRFKRAYQMFFDAKKGKYRNFLKTLIPSGLRKWVRQDALMKSFEYPPMGDEIRKELYERFADEIKQLESIIDRDLSHWRYQ